MKRIPNEDLKNIELEILKYIDDMPPEYKAIIKRYFNWENTTVWSCREFKSNSLFGDLPLTSKRNEWKIIISKIVNK